jgi:DNA-binding GntR family transcriptional regulator
MAALPGILNRFLLERCQVQASFDLDDALQRLTADGLVAHAPDGGLTVLPPDEAQRRLDTLWDAMLDPEQLDAEIAAEATPVSAAQSAASC